MRVAERIRRYGRVGLLAVAVAGAVPPMAHGHGERNQEPFLRMRTAHWYDVKWSSRQVEVNAELVITGRVRLFEAWPHNLPAPETVFLGSGTPGPVFVRTASYLNGTPMMQSTSLQVGREYEFKTVLRGRVPGRHHVHPMLHVEDAGPLLGPGAWIEVTGDQQNFSLPVTTLTGERIEDLETWGVPVVLLWHGLWIGTAVLWLLWWVRRPMFAPRYAVLRRGSEAGLITPVDLRVGVVLLVGTVLVVFGGYQWAEAKYPRTIPLQAGRVEVEAPPASPNQVRVKVLRASYDVPGRSMRVRLQATNGTETPVRLGEFTTANLRFVDRHLTSAVAAVDPDYPEDLVAKLGLIIDKRAPLQPGETRTINIEMTDAVWEVEHLIALLNNPDSRFGALLFFYDADGRRHITTIAGSIVPTFVSATVGGG